MRNAGRWRLLMRAALVAVMLSATGCASVGHYFEHRYRDFTRMIDLGVTVSRKPQIGLYWNSLELVTIGYSKVEGHFIGWGGGQTRRHSHVQPLLGAGLRRGHRSAGGPLLDTDRREDVIVRRRSGVLGIATSVVGWDPTGDGYGNGPDYTPACVHFIHLGWIGLAGNARYAEIVQFAVGWFGLDITGHDGDRYPVGKWSFPTRKEPKPVPQTEPVQEKTATSPGPNKVSPAPL